MSKPGISFIVWMNDERLLGKYILPSLNPGYQVGDFDLQLVVVSQTAQARNIGQAYNMGIESAMHPNRVFLHQDVDLTDRRFVQKTLDMLARPEVGGIGVIGSTTDTGAAFFHAPLEEQKGRLYGHWWPEEAEVALVDGFLLATNQPYKFAEEYETVHMAVEDYCLQIRQGGRRVYTIDSHVEHYSPGTLDDAYWRSAYRLRRKWAHYLPYNLPSLRQYVMTGVPGVRMQAEFDFVVL